MSNQLTNIRIEELHGTNTFDITIKDNVLVLVGENGIGKSTVANLIYFLLTFQWSRMQTYNFKSISAVIDSKKFSISHDELVDKSLFFELSKLKVSESFIHSVISRLDDSPDDTLSSLDFVSYLSTKHGMPSSLVRRYIEVIRQEVNIPSSKNIERITQAVKKSIKSKVLYLPTYRRIEQDLASIFHGSERETRQIIDRVARRNEANDYIELIEFGMRDVENNIQRKMNELKDSLRDDLNNLTSTYLRDVIQGAYRSAEPSKISELDKYTIDALFNRVDKTILPEPQQERLRDIIEKIKRDNFIVDDDKVVAHFLTRLIELNRAQQEKEKDIREFVNVCNNYLSGKEIVYDNTKFEINIQQPSDEANKGKIAMSMLSSGEKQIISLFSHIYLSGHSDYFVMIDEPELSLSVFWQRRFLTDILDTGRCSGLIAVTHSPFIFENRLNDYTHSLDEFRESLNGIS